MPSPLPIRTAHFSRPATSFRLELLAARYFHSSGRRNAVSKRQGPATSWPKSPPLQPRLTAECQKPKKRHALLTRTLRSQNQHCCRAKAAMNSRRHSAQAGQSAQRPAARRGGLSPRKPTPHPTASSPASRLEHEAQQSLESKSPVV